MLTDMIEGEFDMKEEEPWYDHQDLEHDLHLAAELGKNLLEQNRDFEETLQQMYITNQEQMQEIEYLSKQVDLLRSVIDQQAKAHEQLDASAQELELEKQRLLQEKRAANIKIQGLTETVEELQRVIQKMELDSERERTRVELEERRESGSTHSLSSLEGRCCVTQEERDEHRELLRSTQSLQTQLSSERAHREAAQQEVDALEQEVTRLEPRAAMLPVYEERLAELEEEVQELRLLVHSGQSQLSLDDAVGGAEWSGRGERQEGVSLLKEVDAQYAALQEKYDTLLRRCSDGAAHTHTQADTHSHSAQDTQPEYKALFQEIFSFIQKSKQDLKERSNKPGQAQ